MFYIIYYIYYIKHIKNIKFLFKTRIFGKLTNNQVIKNVTV
jgi:hypothetical protein